MTNDQLQALIDTLESALAVWPEVEKVGFRKSMGLCWNLQKLTRTEYAHFVREVSPNYKGYSGGLEYPVKSGSKNISAEFKYLNPNPGKARNLYTGQYGRNRKNFAKYLVRTAKAQLKVK